MDGSIKKSNNTNLILEKQLEDIFLLLKKYINKDQRIYLGVSGGSDSMLLVDLVLKYYLKNKLNTKNIYILHYNHHQRKMSTVDENFVHNRCKNKKLTFVGASFFGNYNETENRLRKGRWDFFKSILHTQKNPILLTGHHLDDRIETTILNLVRGCHKKGFYNMSTYKKCLIRDDFYNILQFVYLRPLLNIPKDIIYILCKKHKIDFVVDKTNIDSSMSQRNKLRKYLSAMPCNYKKMFGQLYNTDIVDISEINFNTLKKFNHQIKEYYQLSHIYYIIDIIKILEFTGTYTNISKGYLEELLGFVSTGSGTKTIKDRHLIKAHGKVYLILAGEQFRKDLKTNKIQGMRHRGKSLSKRYINQKIPFFLRQELVFEMKDGLICQPLHHKEVVEKGWLA